MQRKSMPELDKLFNEVRAYRKSKELKELLDFVKRFPYIAPYNAMLLHIQKPGSQYVASAAEWVKRFDRTIKPGARPLIILRPFGPVAFVFELNDTEGEKPFPETLLNPFRSQGQVSQYEFDNLIKNMKYDGISYSEVNYGTAYAGLIQTNTNRKEQSVIRGSKEIWLKVLYNMVVNSAHELETKFSTILHELGHVYCGHLGTPYEKWWVDRSFLELNEQEFEAESVCWLVSERMGVKNPSAEYLSGYISQYNEIPNISIDTVLKAAGMIETMINNRKELRKEIVVKTSGIEK